MGTITDSETESSRGTGIAEMGAATDRARQIARAVVREAVKDAVREAIEEYEAERGRGGWTTGGGSGGSTEGSDRSGERATSQDASEGDSGGGSRLPGILLFLLVVAAGAYLASQRDVEQAVEELKSAAGRGPEDSAGVDTSRDVGESGSSDDGAGSTAGTGDSDAQSGVDTTGDEITNAPDSTAHGETEEAVSGDVGEDSE